MPLSSYIILSSPFLQAHLNLCISWLGSCLVTNEMYDNVFPLPFLSESWALFPILNNFHKICWIVTLSLISLLKLPSVFKTHCRQLERCLPKQHNQIQIISLGKHDRKQIEEILVYFHILQFISLFDFANVNHKCVVIITLMEKLGFILFVHWVINVALVLEMIIWGDSIPAVILYKTLKSK